MGKKLLFAVFVLAIVLSLTVAHAQENETSGNGTADEDMREAEVMHFSLGAQVRLMQLEDSVSLAITAGQHALDVISNNSYNVSGDALSRMNEIVTELTDLKANISNEISLNDTNSSVAFFVSSKQEATNLTQEFRQLLRTQLTPDELKAIMQSANDDEKNATKQLRHDIVDKIMEFNRERAKDLFGKMNITDPDAWRNFTFGNVTVNDMRDYFRNRFMRLNTTTQMDFLSKINDDRKQIQLARNTAFSQRLNLGETEKGKMKNIVDDSNLTFDEMRAKIGVLMRNTMQERMQIMRNLTQNVKDDRNQIRGDIKDIRGQMRNRTGGGIGANVQGDAQVNTPQGSGKIGVQVGMGNRGGNNEN